jgi:sulfate adenylyltransferase subunit 1
MATLLSPAHTGEQHDVPSPDSRGELRNGSASSAIAENQAAGSFSIAEFLEAERKKDLLRLSTAGSVDDGKSTLIGRLLYDSRNVYEDHVRAVTRNPGGNAKASIDFAQLTDGLRAEREQGITIDVAYRYFSTEHRNFIIADTPGHEQYTRNMATGASTSHLAIILIDATKGILTQSRRHVYITSLLGIRHLVAAINKMDLVGFSPEVFARIERQFSALVRQLGNAEVTAIPLSALNGDNVVEPSANMPWYQGPTLLQYLEAVPVRHDSGAGGFRLPVQRVIRPHVHYPQPNFRGFAGQIAAGGIRVGDQVVALPSGRTSRVASITTFDGDLEQASAPQSVSISLEDEIDISRGDFLADAAHPPRSASALRASLVWFDGRPLDPARSYLLKHASQTVGARIQSVHHRVDVQTLEHESVDSLAMNDIGQVEIETVRPLFFDSYEQNRITGSFVLIDPETNATAAAGMIQGASGKQSQANALHRPAVLLARDSALASALESALLGAGCAVVRTRRHDPALWRGLSALGVITLVEPFAPSVAPSSAPGHAAVRLAVLTDGEPQLEDLLPPGDPAPSDGERVQQTVELLRRREILRADGNQELA